MNWIRHIPTVAAAALGASMISTAAAAHRNPAGQSPTAPETWRHERRFVDLHQHVESHPDRLARCVRLMDQTGIGLVVNLSGGTVTPGPDGISEFQRNRDLAEKLFPGRFVLYMSLDYKAWDEPDFPARAAQQIEQGHRLGAAGFKEYKRLGLYLRDGAGKLIRVDDPKLDPVWKRCGELGMPVSIHVADPQAFWRPYDATNERWTELKDHPRWWFGDPAKYPSFQDLLDALNRVIERHPGTTFVGVHFANNAEDLDWVERTLDRYPNLMADLAARVPELGRHDPARVRQLFTKHADRILFGTDFQVYDRLTLGSGGEGPAPTDADALEFFAKHWRWFETNDRQFEHMTPIQGDWRIDAIGLPPEALRQICFDNARRLLVRSLPLPTTVALRIARDLRLDGRLKEPAWTRAPFVSLDRTLREGRALPTLETQARLLWSDRYLYVAFDAPYAQLNTFDPPVPPRERLGLWDRDVVEVFVAPDPQHPEHYAELEVAPTGEKLDVFVRPSDKDFDWTSGFEAATRVDRRARRWTTELRISWKALGVNPPVSGDRWRLNLYRNVSAHPAFLAWNPTASGTAHRPERFGILEFR